MHQKLPLEKLEDSLGGLIDRQHLAGYLLLGEKSSFMEGLYARLKRG